MAPMVATVLGPVPAEEMGVTDAHNHLWISDVGAAVARGPVLDQPAFILEELKQYKATGGRSQIDCQPAGAGRDGNRLRQLSQQSGVQVVACTGFHLERYYPAGSDMWTMDIDQAADYFQGELRQGLVETRSGGEPVLPGFIKIAVLDSVDKTPLSLMEAAAVVSARTNCAIEMHTEKGAAVEEFLELLSGFGMQPSRLIICHIDKRPDLGLHLELAGAGCGLEYDTFFRPKYDPESNLWPLLRGMIAAGQEGAVCLATDLADKQMWRTMGNGPGLVGFAQDIKDRLSVEIGDERIIAKLMGGNIAQRLAVPVEESSA